MEESPFSKRSLILSLGLSGALVITILVISSTGSSTKVVFCDVGQGDATYIRIKNKIDILIDTGPNQSVLQCLGRYLPFFDKKIELVILTHFQKDHYGGFLSLLNRYKVEQVMTLNSEQNPAFVNFKDKLTKQNIKLYFPTNKTKIKLLDANIKFIWPVQGDTKNYSINDSSLIFLFEELGYKIFFTGDTSAKILNTITKQTNVNKIDLKTNVLKIPHHGSKNGLSLGFLKIADPSLSIISAGRKNPYGHPSQEVLNALSALNKKYLRTDIKGDIVLKLP